MNVTLWYTSSDVRKELSIQDDRTESDNRIEVTQLIGIAENNLPHIARWESTKPPYAEPHVRWCGRSVNVKIGGKCLLWLAFTSYPICWFYLWLWIEPIRQIHPNFYRYWRRTAKFPFLCPYLCSQQLAATGTNEQFQVWFRVWYHIRTLIKRKRKSARERKCGFYMLLHLTLWKFLNE